METAIRQIGNSRGIILSGEAIDHWGLEVGDKIAMRFDGHRLILEPVSTGISFEEAVLEVFEEDREILRELADR